MGRYYSGDIEGKFWFGVQTSDDAEQFGGLITDGEADDEGNESNEINCYFSKEDLPKIKSGIAKCEKALGDNLAKLDKFFSDGGEGYAGYNDEMVANYLGIAIPDKDKWKVPAVDELLTQYARLQLGLKILKCVKVKGDCGFSAEL